MNLKCNYRNKANIILFYLSLLTTNAIYGQSDWKKMAGDEWYNEVGSKGVTIGELVPNLTMEHVINNKTGKSTLYEFRGKLLILDFWNTACSACISSFPRMENLQNEFGDKIQVILINQSETKEKIETFFKNGSMKLPDLPIIAADRNYGGSIEDELKSQLYRVFPIRTYPHHVWVDTIGRIIISGPAANTYPDKIRKYFNGKQITNLNSPSTVPTIAYNEENPYYKFVGIDGMPAIGYGVFITPFNNNIGGFDKFTFSSVDSSKRIRRITSMNEEVIEIFYSTIFSDSLNAENYGNSIFFPFNRWFFMKFPEDTLNYTSSFIRKNRTDIEYIQSRYCVEQIVPLEYPHDQQIADLLSQLNQYFRFHLGVEAHLESRKIPCYILEKYNKVTNSGLASFTTSRISYTSEGKNNTTTMRNAITDLIVKNPKLFTEFKKNLQIGKPAAILDETELDSNKSISPKLFDVKTAINNIEEFKKLLVAKGFSLLEAERNFNFLVIKKVNRYKK